ncbi:hypothetical protein EBN03_14195 [Nocardia stercoris]|uniref:DUF4760 domain-containing protein n=1 Tax=Nocardia stercoris TaxID=2483361 RepID=A0A3M2L3D6_9NOCA|nr:hypothetical protein EBN03_14195 [Nocardia stercoris]
MDLAAIGVATVSVTGTLGAAVVTQFAVLRGKRIEGENQRLEHDDERRDAARRAAADTMRSTYADLNSATRAYRTAIRDQLAGFTDEPDVERVELARKAFHDLYAAAQMIMSEHALEVAGEVNLCLGLGYGAWRNARIPEPELDAWFAGPGSEAAWLLRHALRVDLGVIEPDPKTADRLRTLRAQRIDLFGDDPDNPRRG